MEEIISEFFSDVDLKTKAILYSIVDTLKPYFYARYISAEEFVKIMKKVVFPNGKDDVIRGLSLAIGPPNVWIEFLILGSSLEEET